MKSSLFRTVVIFVAGAGSATVVAGLYPDDQIDPEKFLELGNGLLNQVEKLGGYVAVAEDGRIGIYTMNVGACVFPPVPPKWPANAVDPRSLELGLAALRQLNHAHLAEDGQPVYVLGKCRPYAASYGR